MNIGALAKINGKAVGTLATKTLGKSSLVLRKYSPEILTSVGVVGVVTAGVLASKATLHLEPIVDNTNEKLEAIHHKKETLTAEEYSSSDSKKDTVRVFAHTSIDIVKLYGPSVTLGVVSIGCIVGAHGIMRKRNVALAAAYKTIEQAYGEYRKRVIEEFGEDKDREYRQGVIRTEEVKGDDGKTTVVSHIDPNGLSPYAKFFDELNPNWRKEAELNLFFLKSQQAYAQNLLHARGHVLLNDVYDMLAIPRTKAGAVVGWTLSKDGDNYIDFGIYDFTNEDRRAFVNGEEASILLDFNVDGLILDAI